MGGTAVSGEALAAAFESALESALASFTIYTDKVPASPSLPYVFLLTSFPVVGGRSATRRVQFRHLRARTVVVGLTAGSVRIGAQKLTQALEGKRLTVPGWTLGAIESEPNNQPIQPDNDVIIPGTSDHPLYQPFDWILTGSET